MRDYVNERRSDLLKQVRACVRHQWSTHPDVLDVNSRSRFWAAMTKNHAVLCPDIYEARLTYRIF